MQRPPRLDIAHEGKFQHAFAYGLLMLWFAQLAIGRLPRLRSAMALVGLGAALEFAQLATASQTFSFVDVLADPSGVAMGWILAPPRLPNWYAVVERITVGRIAG